MMVKKLRSRANRQTLFQNPVIVGAIITGTVTVLVALINVLPQLDRSEPEPSAAPVSTFPPTAAVGITATNSTPGDGQTPTATLPALESETPTPTPAFATFNCLSSWWRVNTGKISTPTPTPMGAQAVATPDGCLVLPELGISVGDGGLIFSQIGLRDVTGAFGIAHPIQSEYIIHLAVTTRALFNAEFWVAVSTDKAPTVPDAVSVVMIPGAQGNDKVPGTIVLYRNSVKRDDKLWAEIDKNNQPGPPFTYDFEIRVTGGSVVVMVNGQRVADERGIFPTYLFLGYQKKAPAGTILVDVNVRGLAFEAIP